MLLCAAAADQAGARWRWHIDQRLFCLFQQCIDRADSKRKIEWKVEFCSTPTQTDGQNGGEWENKETGNGEWHICRWMDGWMIKWSKRGRNRMTSWTSE